MRQSVRKAGRMNPLVVYGRGSSSNVQAVMWGLAELGLEATRHDLGGRFGGLDTAAFRAMNPTGLIPVLQADGLILFESAVILRHLANSHGRGPFWPAGPQARARVDQWAEWGKHSFGAAFTGPVFWAHWRTPEAARDVDAVTAAIVRFEAQMQIAADEIAKGGFMVGSDLTLADIWVGHVLYRYFTLDIPRDPPPGLVDYYTRLTQRPTFATHVMVDYSELKATLT